MQVQIRFIARGSSSFCGGFAHGDLLRCNADVARHLVDECGAAVYVPPPKPAAGLVLQPVNLPAVPVIETPADTIAAVCGEPTATPVADVPALPVQADLVGSIEQVESIITSRRARKV